MAKWVFVVAAFAAAAVQATSVEDIRKRFPRECLLIRMRSAHWAFALCNSSMHASITQAVLPLTKEISNFLEISYAMARKVNSVILTGKNVGGMAAIAANRPVVKINLL